MPLDPTLPCRWMCAPRIRHLLLALLPALVLITSAPSALAFSPLPVREAQAVLVPQDEVIVFAPQVGADEARSSAIAAGLEPLAWNEALGALTVRSAVGGSRMTAVSSVAQELPVRFSEPDVPAALQSGVDDPLVDQQWSLATIDATTAWTLAPQASDVVVAILDSGVALSHEDLVDQLVPGTDIFDGDDDPTDAFGHGTMVAGIVGATHNNGLGVAGVANGVRIMPVKITNDSGNSSYSRIANGITWAADHGADIITISSGATVESELLANAVSYARDRDVVVVAAAGNGGDTTPFFPAAIDGVIGVAATTTTDTLWTGSSHGSWLSLAAPGQGILSTHLSGYVQGSGSSFAAPHVAAVAAMVRSVDQGLAETEVAAILESSTTDLGSPGFDGTFGHGRLDAGAAVAAAADSTPSHVSCGAQSTLIVVGRKVSSADRAIGDRLTTEGHVITYQPSSGLSITSAAGYDLVVLSTTARQRDLPDDMATIEAPVLTLSPESIPLLGMSGQKKNSDLGKERRSSTITVVDDTPLSANLGGSIQLVSSSTDLYWSRPAASAIVAASVDGDLDRATLFGYPTGSTLAVGAAPARRTAMPLSQQSVEALTTDGWDLLDAASAWTSGCSGG